MLIIKELYDWLHDDDERAIKFFNDLGWREGFNYCMYNWAYFHGTGYNVIAQAAVRSLIREATLIDG